MKFYYLILLLIGIGMSEENSCQKKHFFNIKKIYTIMKVGDEYSCPDYDHPTIKIFSKIRKNNPTKIVLCLVHSPDSKIATYRYKKDLFNLKILNSEFIFKMPNSPKHTFVIIDKKDPGIIVARSKNNRIINITNLGKIIDDIVKLETSVDKNRMIDFSKLPHFVFGNIN